MRRTVAPISTSGFADNGAQKYEGPASSDLTVIRSRAVVKPHIIVEGCPVSQCS